MIFVKNLNNSLINYDDNDKIIINENSNKKYYKYQKDIGILINCSENDEVTFNQLKENCLNV